MRAEQQPDQQTNQASTNKEERAMTKQATRQFGVVDRSGLRRSAPAIYKPQPTPKVLQTRMAVGSPRPSQFRVNSTPPVATRFAHVRPQSEVSSSRVKLI